MHFFETLVFPQTSFQSNTVAMEIIQLILLVAFIKPVSCSTEVQCHSDISKTEQQSLHEEHFFLIILQITVYEVAAVFIILF